TTVQPAAVDAVLRACLERDPEQRWQSVRDVRRALELPMVAGVSARSPWRERAGWIAGAGALLVALLYVAFAKAPGEVTGARVQLAVNPPERTGFVGTANVTVQVPLFAISPNGRWLVLSAAAPGAKSILWLRSIADGSTSMLSGTEDAQYPFWS